MNDFDKAIAIVGDANVLANFALEKVVNFNKGLGLTEEEKAQMQKVYDRIRLASVALCSAIESMEAIAPQFDND